MRAAERGRRGWIGTLVSLCLLVVVGFLAGALAGFLWEEPRLVLAYFSGETESVEWSDPESVAPPLGEPPVAPEDAGAPLAALESAPEATQTAEDAEPAPAASEAPRAEAPAARPPPAVPPPGVAAPPPSGGRFAVQVGAFGERSAADQLAARLRQRGYASYVVEPAAAGQPWRVRVGRVAERSQAESLAAKLARGEKLPTWVLDEGAS